jgi:lipopolysaccharide/colanic/teichoic acid biosynthesis glycosyltransferase
MTGSATGPGPATSPETVGGRSRDESLRRAFDLAVAAGALVLTAPLMLTIALAVRLETPGPILFGQTRLGRGGHPFTMYKFRKFRADAGTQGCPLTMRDDARMTGVGRALMRSKLDELPQLWNVLRGEMAVIGPRPESLAFADCFRDGFERLLEHRPGLLGPAQIQFRDEAALYATGSADAPRFYRSVLFPAKARIDLAYLRRRTLGSDARLLLQGVAAVFGLHRAPVLLPANDVAGPAEPAAAPALTQGLAQGITQGITQGIAPGLAQAPAQGPAAGKAAPMGASVKTAMPSGGALA